MKALCRVLINRVSVRRVTKSERTYGNPRKPIEKWPKKPFPQATSNSTKEDRGDHSQPDFEESFSS